MIQTLLSVVLAAIGSTSAWAGEWPLVEKANDAKVIQVARDIRYSWRRLPYTAALYDFHFSFQAKGIRCGSAVSGLTDAQLKSFSLPGVDLGHAEGTGVVPAGVYELVAAEETIPVTRYPCLASELRPGPGGDDIRECTRWDTSAPIETVAYSYLDVRWSPSVTLRLSCMKSMAGVNSDGYRVLTDREFFVTTLGHLRVP